MQRILEYITDTYLHSTILLQSISVFCLYLVCPRSETVNVGKRDCLRRICFSSRHVDVKTNQCNYLPTMFSATRDDVTL